MAIISVLTDGTRPTKPWSGNRGFLMGKTSIRWPSENEAARSFVLDVSSHMRLARCRGRKTKRKEGRVGPEIAVGGIDIGFNLNCRSESKRTKCVSQITVSVVTRLLWLCPPAPPSQQADAELLTWSSSFFTLASWRSNLSKRSSCFNLKIHINTRSGEENPRFAAPHRKTPLIILTD